MSGYLINEKTGLIFEWTKILSKKRNLRSVTKAEEKDYLATFEKTSKKAVKVEENFLIPEGFDPFIDISKLNLLDLKSIADGLEGFQYSQKDKVGALRVALQDHLNKLKGIYDPNRVDALNDEEEAE
ncbi:MAG: hypothetical protein V4629_03080 [Pseudomonadota bacterium]